MLWVSTKTLNPNLHEPGSKRGRKLISKQQKQISKTDYLELEWSMLAEYTAYKLAYYLDDGN